VGKSPVFDERRFVKWVTANLYNAEVIKVTEEIFRLRHEQSTHCLQKPINPQEGNLIKT